MCFGTDGDKALVEAFAHNFPHLCRNIHERLHTLGIPPSVAEALLTDIFGKQHGSTYIESLVDCRSEQEFDEKLQGLERTWNDREQPYCPGSSA